MARRKLKNLDPEPELAEGEEHEGEGLDEEERDMRGGGEESHEAPIQAQGCPLFLDLTAYIKTRVEGLKVHKIDPPNEGFRGKMPKWADETYIAQKWGNGHFRVEAVNHVGKILRTREILLNVDERPPETGGEYPLALPPGDSEFAMQALRDQTEAHRSEVDRLERLSRDVNTQVRDHGTKYLDMVQAQSVAAAQRDRAFYESQSDHMKHFFGSLMAQSQQAHAQSLQMAQENFRQSMLAMQQANLQAQQANNPALLMGILMKGLELGRGMETPEEPTEPWVQAVTAGVDGLKSLVQLKAAEALPMKAARLPGAAPARALPNPATPGAEAAPKVFDRAEIKGLVEVKLLCEQKGVDFDELLKMAKTQVSSLPDAPFEDEEEGEEGEGDLDPEHGTEDGDDASDSPESDGDGEGPPNHGRATAGALAPS